MRLATIHQGRGVDMRACATLKSEVDSEKRGLRIDVVEEAKKLVMVE